MSQYAPNKNWQSDSQHSAPFCAFATLSVAQKRAPFWLPLAWGVNCHEGIVVMNGSLNRWYYFSGLLAPIWLLLGVALAGSFYPEYSHFNQAMSELGAKGSPTHALSPLLNNYPLAVLFVLFGIGVIKTFPTSNSPL